MVKKTKKITALSTMTKLSNQCRPKDGNCQYCGDCGPLSQRCECKKCHGLSNFEKISKAWAMSYAAVLNGSYVVIGLGPKSFTTRKGLLGCANRPMEFAEDMTITNFIYAGQLAGNEPIPEGQRFRVKEDNITGKYRGETSLKGKRPGIYLTDSDWKMLLGPYKKEEIEPVFD